jgi:hypothetical protein
MNIILLPFKTYLIKKLYMYKRFYLYSKKEVRPCMFHQDYNLKKLAQCNKEETALVISHVLRK